MTRRVQSIAEADVPRNCPVSLAAPALGYAKVLYYAWIYRGHVLRLSRRSAWVLFETRTTGWKLRRIPLRSADGELPILVPGRTWADMLTAKHTAFGSLKEMADANGGYRPSLISKSYRAPIVSGEIELLANAYDDYQRARKDPRRAYRGL